MVEKNQPFVVKVTAEKTTYDADWNPTTTTIPLENAKTICNDWSHFL